MNFNPDPSKQSREIIFSRKTKKIYHHSLRFNNNNLSQILYQKHIGIFLDAQLTFDGYLKVITTEVNKTVRLLHKLQKKIAKTGINDYIKCFRKTASRLW